MSHCAQFSATNLQNVSALEKSWLWKKIHLGGISLFVWNEYVHLHKKGWILSWNADTDSPFHLKQTFKICRNCCKYSFIHNFMFILCWLACSIYLYYFSCEIFDVRNVVVISNMCIPYFMQMIYVLYINLIKFRHTETLKPKLNSNAIIDADTAVSGVYLRGKYTQFLFYFTILYFFHFNQ